MQSVLLSAGIDAKAVSFLEILVIFYGCIYENAYNYRCNCKLIDTCLKTFDHGDLQLRYDTFCSSYRNTNCQHRIFEFQVICSNKIVW